MEENEKSYGKLEWIFYIVVLPLFFTLILTALLLTFLGENITDTAIGFAKKIPGVSQLLPAELTEADPEEGMQSLEDALNSLEESHAETIQLQQDVAEKVNEIAQLKNQISLLEQDLEDKLIDAEEHQSKLRELASIYEGMPSKKAAAVLENLTLSEAALLIQQMPKNQQSAIMAKLTPEKAANITVVLKDLEKVEDVEMAALQERIAVLMDSVEEATATVTINQLVNTFSQMPTKKAAELLSEMNKTNEEFQLALKILALMNDATRSGILSEMENNVARSYINSLANK